MGEQEDSSLPPHVLIFPLPIQGHVNSMLHLAKLLCFAGGVHVTFFVSDFVHRRLLRHSANSFRHPFLRLRTLSDGLPDDHPRAGLIFKETMPAIKNVMAPMFRDMMVNSDCLRSGDRRPVTCIISDGLLSFAGDFALERGIPLLYFPTGSACSFWACFCFQEVMDAGEVPIKGNGMDLPVKSVPGTEGVLRRRDLPTFCRVDYISDPIFQFINTETRQTPRAHAVILNTFEALEASVLCHIRGPMPNLFTIGPLHSLLNTKTADIAAATSGSFWEEDRSCVKWLDAQPAKSVIYVSFGSLAVVTREQLVEFWHGLVNSGQRFLWVKRPGSVSGQDGGSQVPAELADATKERGYIVGWAPQEEVLNHPAIGGFLTHSGWNSTLESMVAGVPMICWPRFADQTINSRFVGETWKLGLDMKDTCDRVTIEKMVRDLMVVRKDEFAQSANRMTQLAREAASEGGSSYCNLNRLIEYIRSMVGQG